MFKRSIIHTTAALAASALLFASEAGAQSITIECDLTNPSDGEAPMTLTEYVCLLVADAPVAVVPGLKRGNVTIEQLQQVLIGQSDVTVVYIEDLDAISILQN